MGLFQDSWENRPAFPNGEGVHKEWGVWFRGCPRSMGPKEDHTGPGARHRFIGLPV